MLKRFLRKKNGQGLIEYILIIALIVIVCMVVLRHLSNTASDKLTEIDIELNTQ